jgi:replicative DNA helicase
MNLPDFQNEPLLQPAPVVPQPTLGDAVDSPLDRVPPNDVNAEQAVLGALLVDPQAFPLVLNTLADTSFYRPSHQLIYGTMRKLFDDGLPCDIITVSSALVDADNITQAGGRAYLHDLALAVMTTANIEHHADIVRRKAILRSVINAGMSIVSAGFDADSPDSAVDTMQQIAADVSGGAITSDLVSSTTLEKTINEQMMERIANRGKLTGKPSGFTALDTMTNGFQDGDLIILAARPSMGKTALALNIAHNVAVNEGLPTLFFSLEMSNEQLMNRFISSAADLDAQRVRTGDLDDEGMYRFTQANRRLAQSPLLLDDTASITVSAMKAKAKKHMLQSRQPIGMILVDYIGLIQGKGDNRVNEVSKISRELKHMARELKCPVIALSQLSRAVESRENKRPLMSDLRESGSIEQDADVIMFIYRDEYYNKESDAKGKAEIDVAKQRNGPVGKVSLLFQSNITKFKNPLEYPF